MILSFRPLSGYLISKSTMNIMVQTVQRFRPLSGYLISKLHYAMSSREWVIAFPSPLGVSYFQIEISTSNIAEVQEVSVPSRGILFPNTCS